MLPDTLQAATPYEFSATTSPPEHAYDPVENLNVTEPAGVPEPGDAALTVAVNVRALVGGDGLRDEATVRLV